MPTIYIDGQAYQVEAGNNILQTCLNLGLDLPYFCWHPAMGSIGACRQCALVQYQNEEDSRGRIVIGCMTPVSDGARFSLSGDKAKGFREAIVESLMLNHPHDCPVCAEGGECHLQDMTVMVGHRDRNYRGKKNTHRNQYLGPLINHEMNRCITCYRCTRYYRDYAGGTDLAAMAARDHIYFGRHDDGLLESEFSGNLVEVCPTGVFTDKTLVSEYTRKWDLQSAPSICVGCAVGCNTSPGERYGKLKRIHNRYHHEVNGYFLCDRGRFGGGFVNESSRAKWAGLKTADGSYQAINHTDALDHLKTIFKAGADLSRVAAIGSPRASMESNYLLRRLIGAENFAAGFSDSEHNLTAAVYQQLNQAQVYSASIKDAESADAVLILGEDVTNTAPRLALALRQSVRNKAYQLAAELRLESWQDAAIRNLAQDQRSPLFIASVSATRLADIAQVNQSLAPDDIARLGFAVAARIDTSLESIADLQPELASLADDIAEALKAAQRPLLVSGTSSANENIIQATGAIARALHKHHQLPTMTSFCLAECNSLGAAMMATEECSTIGALCTRAAAGELNTLVVLENDLYCRASKSVVDQLLANVEHLIVLDSVDTPTLSQSTLALPAATFAESEGTLVNAEGRAQRHYPVFKAQQDCQPSWRWLAALGSALDHSGFDTFHHFDEVNAACATDIACLNGIAAAAPAGDFRQHGLKVPRQTHRYSGRTAMVADVSVHEPKQPQDEDTPLSYSMEGINRNQPGALLPFVWSPGWNSNQALHKFQSESSGPLQGGTGGQRLISGQGQAADADKIPSTFVPQSDQLLLVNNYRLYGSEELSAKSPALGELIESPYISLHPQDAANMGFVNGDGATLDKLDIQFEIRLNLSMAQGCGTVFAGTSYLSVGEKTGLSKIEGWSSPRSDLISSDREGNHV